MAAKYADQWHAIVKQSGAKTVLAFSAYEYASFKNIYPRMNKALSDVDILHTTEFVAQLIREGSLSLSLASSGKYAYHDDSQLGRRSEPFTAWQGEYTYVLNTLFVSEPKRPINYGANGNYEAPRELLALINGIELLELERNREFAFDCGAANGIAEIYPDIADASAQELLAEAAHVGAETVVTASALVKRNLQAAIDRHDLGTQVVTLFDFLEQSLQGGQ